MNNCIFTQIYHAPCGDMLLGEYNGKLCLCDWQTERHRAAILNRLQKELHTNLLHTITPLLQETSRQLDEYFHQERQVFDLPLLLVGTDFQKIVWLALQAIPYGKTISYKALAEHIGMPHAVRAVANANGANAISIVLPCHRVIGTNGTLTGYGGGLPIKQYLLQLEQTVLF